MTEEIEDGIISVRAPKSIINKARSIAKKRGYSLSDLVRILILGEIERDEAPEKKSTRKQ